MGAGGREALDRAEAFAATLGLRAPILLAPMAGACPPALSVAVARAGGMAACGALLMGPDEIGAWVREVRAGGDAPLQLNAWIPDPAPQRDPEREAALRGFLAAWGPGVPADAAAAPAPDFAAQCEAMLRARPTAISSIMGLYPPDFVARMKREGVKWFAAVTTVRDAVAARDAGADAIVAQGMEAGGHRGAFRAEDAESEMAGLFSLLPAVVDAVDRPVIAAGGVADATGVAAALLLGASAVQVGTAFLRAPEAGVPSAWADALARARPEDTLVTRAFSGRAGRGLRNRYAVAAAAPDAPAPAPYPIQRRLTEAMRAAAARENRLDAMQAWAGQSAGLGRTAPAGEIVRALWTGARRLLE
jgi:nitronate monooxygenase